MQKIQLGKAIGILLRAYVAEDIMHADVDAWHAPSECHALVARGENERIRRARRRARAASGLGRRGFNLALKRLDPSVRMRAEARIYSKYCPF